MNKNMFFGWREVCAFSYVQTLKSKAMKITLVILCALALFALPVITMIGSAADEDEETNIKQAYIYSNESGLAEKFSSGFDGKYQAVLAQAIDEKTKDEKMSELKKSKDIDYVVLLLTYDKNQESMDYGLEIRVVYGEDSKITSKDADNFAEYVLENKEKLVLDNTDIDAEKKDSLLKKRSYELFSVDTNGNVENAEEGLDGAEYWLTYIYLMIVMFAVIIAGSKVAELIVTEKTSKVMEYLLTSIKPLALLLGKVVGTLLIVFTILLALLASFIGSLVVNYSLSGGEGGFWPKILTDIWDSGVLQGVTIANILISIVMVLLGFIFYGFIAGLAGATVSKIEELAEGLKLFTFTVIIGMYLVIALMSFSNVGDGMGIFEYIVYYLPLSSVFVVPIYLLIGKLSFQMGLISMLILAISTVAVWLFVTKVFASVLYHNGSVMKFKEIVDVYKTNAKSGKSGGKNEK